MAHGEARRPTSHPDQDVLRLEGNLEALPSAALLVALDDLVLDCNAAARRLFQLPGHGSVGRPFQDLGSVAGLIQLRQALDEVKRGGEPRTLSDFALRRPDETEVIALVTLAPVAARGRVLAVLVTAEERTDLASLSAERDQLAGELKALALSHQTAEQTLRRTTEELRAANEDLTIANESLQTKIKELEAAQTSDRKKTEFLAVLAHELRNPLESILTAMHVVRHRASREPTVEQARRVVERQVKHLARLLEDLLDVSRIQRGRIELRKDLVDLAATAADALEDVRHLVQSGKHQVSVSFPPDPLTVDGDRTRLTQVLVNLLNNAAKYTEAGGRISITGYREGAEAVIRVTDTGQGIAPDLLPRVFDMFTQADSSLAHARGGLGIGLTLVRQVVELHGGRVAASSRGLGQGSEFVLRLPLVEGVAPKDSPPASPPSTLLTPRRVLVIEDNRDSREMLRLSLEFEGHHVETAIDGPQGVQAAWAAGPDVVLVDIGLPGLDGYEVARAIRKRLGDAVVLIALTGYGDGEARRRVMEAGFDLHVVKPADPQTLGRLVAECRPGGRAA